MQKNAIYNIDANPFDANPLCTAGGEIHPASLAACREPGEPVEWVEVPYYPNGVIAGVPADTGDDNRETIAVPGQFADDISFVVPVRGQSMRDFDLREGDQLLVRYTAQADSGDFVIACVDGGTTVKVFYEDENGDRWLIPGNPDFKPILLSDESNMRIVGVVKRIIHELPRVSMRDCARILRTQKKTPGNHRAAEFPLFTDTAIREGRCERVFELLRRAAEGTVTTLMEELHHQSLIGNIDYKNYKSTTLREILVDYLGITYGYENIRRHRLD